MNNLYKQIINNSLKIEEHNFQNKEEMNKKEDEKIIKKEINICLISYDKDLEYSYTNKNNHICSQDNCCLCKNISLYDPSGDNMVFGIWDIEEKKKKWICGKCYNFISKNKTYFKKYHI